MSDVKPSAGWSGDASRSRLLLLLHGDRVRSWKLGVQRRRIALVKAEGLMVSGEIASGLSVVLIMLWMLLLVFLVGFSVVFGFCFFYSFGIGYLPLLDGSNRQLCGCPGMMGCGGKERMLGWKSQAVSAKGLLAGRMVLSFLFSAELIVAQRCR